MRTSAIVALLFVGVVSSSCIYYVSRCNCEHRGRAADDDIDGFGEHGDREPQPMLTGQVVDGRGQPVADVEVRVYAGVATRWQTGATRTDERGRFAFAEVHGSGFQRTDDGQWLTYVGVSAGETVDGLNPAAYLPWQDVTIAPGGSGHVQLVLAADEVQRRIAQERARR